MSSCRSESMERKSEYTEEKPTGAKGWPSESECQNLLRQLCEAHRVSPIASVLSSTTTPPSKPTQLPAVQPSISSEATPSSTLISPQPAISQTPSTSGQHSTQSIVFRGQRYGLYPASRVHSLCPAPLQPEPLSVSHPLSLQPSLQSQTTLSLPTAK